jgi:arylsulfatase A-like enzyme
MFVHVTDLHEPIIIPNKFNESQYGSNQYEKQIFAIDNKIGELLKNINLHKTQLVITADHGTYLKQMNIDEKNVNFEDNTKSEVLQKEIGKKIPGFLKPLKDKIFFSQIEHKRKTKLEKIKDMNLSPYQKRNLTSEKFNTKHSLFDELLLVPLLFVGNGCKSKKIKQQVRTVDILPTLLDILKIEFDEKKIDGKSLQSLMNGKKSNENIAYLESNPLIQLKSDDVIGIRTSEYKYFRDSVNSKKRIHLYDLRNDPFENENISNKNIELVEKFENKLQEIINDSNLKSTDENDDEIYKELKKMGYA